MALLTLAEGSSVVTERVFENRFMHVPELQRMGAEIALDGRTAHLRGVSRLMGAQVMLYLDLEPQLRQWIKQEKQLLQLIYF